VAMNIGCVTTCRVTEVTMPKTINVCPECDSARLKRLMDSETAHRLSNNQHWWCGDCGHRFADPNRRERRGIEESYSGHTRLKRAGFGHLIDDTEDADE